MSNYKANLPLAAFAGLLLVLLTSCIPQKRIMYLQDRDGGDTARVFDQAASRDYRLQPGDNLYIRVIGLDESANGMFNLAPGSSAVNYGNSEAGLYLSSYTVDPAGNIRMPVLGSINVKDKSTEEAESAVQQALDMYLKSSTVVIKLVSFYYTVLGEVRRPGRYPVYQPRLSLFEAIGEAGDLTTFGNRNKVRIIRGNSGRTEVLNVDLTRKDILSSPDFYLKPDDIIYVEPLRAKGLVFEAFPYTLIFSTITTTLLILNFLK
ncbi:MAG TPA: polysaccharide biosynthesis/export family protein [Bacteroidales bacterium]|nr:polysaccharide biosynthesis/export family protein [Bacteroidales bacterium]HSA44650.1 polysaccharide biosynthesis/export family protein [Bacteroidales bacterium]